MAKTKRKSSKSAREKRAERTRAARAARRETMAEREAYRRLDELFAEDAPVAQSATLVLERLGGGPVPAGIARFYLLASSAERARMVSAEVSRLAPDTAAALTLAADVAFQLEDDAQAASALLDRALPLADGDDERTTLAGHMLELGRVAQALAIVQEILLENPDDDDAQRIAAAALALAHHRTRALAAAHSGRPPQAAADGEPPPRECPCWSGRMWSECCRPAEERALERFHDRSGLYSLRDRMLRFATTDRALGAMIADDVSRWLQDAGAESCVGVQREGLVRMLTEHAWLVGGDGEDDDDEGGELGVSATVEPDPPLARFAADARTSPSDALAARRWLSHCHYGLWQLDDTAAAPGVWLVDILTGVRRYAAILPEQLEGSARWTVLLGALVAIDGTWRTAGAVMPLRPGEADAVAELAEEMTYAIVSHMSGKTLRSDRTGQRQPAPFGVLATQAEPAAPEVVDLMGKVVGGGLAHLLATVDGIRKAAPRLQNTDGDPLCLISAAVRVSDADAAWHALAARPDIELASSPEGEDDELLWWGRELDEMERATSFAELRAQMRARGEELAVADADGPQRWLRGRIGRRDGAFAIDVNSRERFERLLEMLRQMGEEPNVSEKLVIDPAQDMPQLRAGSMLPLGASEEASAAWLARWPDQRLPALAGRTPRRASRRIADQPRLEALLRELEHDADLLSQRGLRPPDISWLRTELQMPADMWR